MMNNWVKKIITIRFPHFLVLFIVLAFVYDMHITMFYRPQSLHVWRQTDCLSITQNYFQRDLPFFEPEVYNLFCNDGLSGKTAGEFPILYWSVAQLWKVIGKSEFAYRLLVLIISFLGLYAVFRASRQILGNDVQALFTGLLLFTGVTWVSYASNFLPNVPALSFVLIGWYFIWIFYNRGSGKWLWISMLFFTLGMLLKVSAGISFCALLGWIVIEFFSQKKKRILFDRPLINVIPFITAIIVVVAWYYYAEHYSMQNEGKYTFNSVWPIWELSGEKIRADLHGIRIEWSKEFFNRSVLYVTGILWIFLMITLKHRNRFLNWMLIILPFGSIAYALLWFQALNGHDYYWIDFYPPFIMVWILFFKTLNAYDWLKRRRWIIHIVLLVFFIHNVVDCDKRIVDRYVSWKNELYFNHLEAVGELEPMLRDLGVDPDDRVISIPDYTINASLYLMNQRGYNDFGSNFKDPATFEKRISQGAKYLIINDTTLLDDPVVSQYTGELLATYRNVKVYRICDM